MYYNFVKQKSKVFVFNDHLKHLLSEHQRVSTAVSFAYNLTFCDLCSCLPECFNHVSSLSFLSQRGCHSHSHLFNVQRLALVFQFSHLSFCSAGVLAVRR